MLGDLGMARRLAGDPAGLAVAGALATLPAFFVQSSVCRADVLTMLCATAAFDRFLAWAEGPKKTRDLALMYLFTALGILAKGDLDWDYLMMRARQNGARRICSLLLFATSVDVLSSAAAPENDRCRANAANARNRASSFITQGYTSLIIMYLFRHR